VRHYASSEFWRLYRALPKSVRELADKNFALLKLDARHPSLRFKKIGHYYSARVGLAHRAPGVAIPDGILWFWIGHHSGYDKLIG
jgi:hypothetical protein